MPRFGEMFPTKWLGAKDLVDKAGDPFDLVLTIDKIVEEEIGQARDRKWVVYFLENPKGLVLNKTNTSTIAKLHGEDTDDWEGCRVTLYATEVQFQGDMVEAIRIRSKVPKDHKPSSKMAVKPVDDADHNSDEVPF